MISLLKSTFSPSENRVLLVGGDRAILYLFAGGEMSQAYVFSADETGLNTFSRCMAELEAATLSVLVDVVEEEYRQDTIPHVSGADRKAVLERKFARLFRGTPYRHSLRQGRESGERRDDRVLLTAITRPEVVTPWLEILAEHKVPVGGMYSLPILGRDLLRRIGASGPNVLLISAQKASGLRQSFFRDGHLKISRLAHMPRLGSVPFAGYLLGEVEKLRRYLNSLALISRDAPLQIYILSHGPLLDELEQHCRDTDDEKFLLLDVADVARRVRLKRPAESHYADVVFAKLLAGRNLPNHYAQAEETQAFSMHRLRSALAVVALMLLVISAGWSGFSFIEGVMLKEQALDAAQKAEFYQHRFEMARRKLPATPVEPREIKTAVDVIQQLHAYKATPEVMLAILSQALNQVPVIQLDGVDWQSSSSPDGNSDKSRNSRDRNQPEIDIEGEFDAYQIAEVSGHVAPFDGDFRRAIATIDELAANLKEQTGVAKVEVLQYPLDVSSESSVSGSTTRAQERVTASFRMKLIVGVDHGQQNS